MNSAKVLINNELFHYLMIFKEIIIANGILLLIDISEKTKVIISMTIFLVWYLYRFRDNYLKNKREYDKKFYNEILGDTIDPISKKVNNLNLLIIYFHICVIGPILEEIYMSIIEKNMRTLEIFDDIIIPSTIFFSIIHFTSLHDFISIKSWIKFFIISLMRYMFYSANLYQMIIYHIINNHIFLLPLLIVIYLSPLEALKLKSN